MLPSYLINIHGVVHDAFKTSISGMKNCNDEMKMDFCFVGLNNFNQGEAGGKSKFAQKLPKLQPCQDDNEQFLAPAFF